MIKSISSIFLNFLLFASILLLSACGGGDGEDGGSNNKVLSGIFVDSPVQGLSWVSGDLAGTTDAAGTFQYTDGSRVSFYIGGKNGILIGSAAGGAVIIPMDLVATAQTFNDPTVLNIVRFLMTLDNDNDPSNGIQINEAVAGLATGITVNFVQTSTAFSASAILQTLINDLTTVTNAGPHVLTATATAQVHAASSLQGILAGNYSGTYSGDGDGTWTAQLSLAGNLTGTVNSTVEGLLSFVGTVNMDGSGTTIFTTSGGVSDGTVFSGVFNPNGSASGSWNYFDEETGSWSGSKISDLAAPSGSDTTAPVITLVGTNPYSVTVNTTFTDPGTTVTDNIDTGLVASASGSVDTATVGTYTLTYTVSDAARNAAVPVTRTVIVSEVMSTLSNPTLVVAGYFHTCALDDTGVVCWGLNTNGQTTVPTLSNPTQVAAGGTHTCTLDDTGVVCWGNNANGRTTVPTLSNPTQVTAGLAHTCALDDTGVVCWGFNSSGPTTVPTLSNPTQVTAGVGHTCALDDTGVVCWGLNNSGQTTVPTLSNPTLVVAGSSGHTCALNDTGVVCWGANVFGESTVPTLSNPAQLSAGTFLTCALDDTGVVCWGRNGDGQTTVPTLSNPTQVSASGNHACALDDTGVVCWGRNDDGQTDVP